MLWHNSLGIGAAAHNNVFASHSQRRRLADRGERAQTTAAATRSSGDDVVGTIAAWHRVDVERIGRRRLERYRRCCQRRCGRRHATVVMLSARYTHTHTYTHTYTYTHTTQHIRSRERRGRGGGGGRRRRWRRRCDRRLRRTALGGVGARRVDDKVFDWSKLLLIVAEQVVVRVDLNFVVVDRHLLVHCR
jgi:hypothetical protein